MEKIFSKKFLQDLNPKEIYKWTDNKGCYNVLFEGLNYPDTCDYKDADLISMLCKHKTLFIKPNWGSYGRNQLKIDHKGEKFTVRYPLTVENPLIVECSSLEEVIYKVRTFIRKIGRGRKWAQKFIIQEGVEPLLCEDLEAKIRVLLQRDENGVQHLASYLGVGSSSFGKMVSFETYKKTYQISPEIIEKMMTTAFEVHRRIEERSGVQMVRNGLDFIITKDDVYLIETNGVPSLNRIEQIYGNPEEYSDLAEIAQRVVAATLKLRH